MPDGRRWNPHTFRLQRAHHRGVVTPVLNDDRLASVHRLLDLIGHDRRWPTPEHRLTRQRTPVLEHPELCLLVTRIDDRAAVLHNLLELIEDQPQDLPELQARADCAGDLQDCGQLAGALLDPLLQRLRHQVALRHILGEGDDMEGAVRRVPHARHIVLYPELRAVFADIPLLDDEARDFIREHPLCLA